MYPSDLTDAGWKRIAHHFRPKDRRGSGCKHEKKRIVDAIVGADPGIDLNIVSQSWARGFTVLPKRWIVERTFA